MKYSSLALLAALVAACSATLYDFQTTDVTQYNAVNFDRQVTNNRAKGITVVHFYQDSGEHRFSLHSHAYFALLPTPKPCRREVEADQKGLRETRDRHEGHAARRRHRLLRVPSRVREGEDHGVPDGARVPAAPDPDVRLHGKRDAA